MEPLKKVILGLLMSYFRNKLPTKERKNTFQEHIVFFLCFQKCKKNVKIKSVTFKPQILMTDSSEFTF